MTEQELQKLVHRLRKLHRAERRRAWWRGRVETLVLGAAFCGAAWLMWDDNTLESACLGAFGLILAFAALT
jgi:fatty acid desaturase